MTVLVVAAHPDDEVLGCGGTIARHAAEGDTVHIVIVAEGATSRDGAPEGGARALSECAAKAAAVLGAEAPRMLGHPDNRLDSVGRLDVIKAIESQIDAINPDTVYTHHGGDLNIDHRIVHEAVVTACRPLPGSPVRRIFSFEARSSTEWSTPAIGVPFQPTRYVDVSAHFAAKVEAFECYATEIRPFPHPRSVEGIEALARLRGSEAGFEAAEAFQTELDLAF